MTEGVYNLTWAVALVVAITGVVAIGFRLTPEGWWLLAIGGSVLGALAIRAAWQSSRAGVAQPVGCRRLVRGYPH